MKIVDLALLLTLRLVRWVAQAQNCEIVTYNKTNYKVSQRNEKAAEQCINSLVFTDSTGQEHCLASNPNKTMSITCSDSRPKCYCGLANRGTEGNRIFRGNTTKKNEYPWMVRVGSNYNCGGSLINNKWVLTAGHCVEKINHKIVDVRDVIVYLGDHDINDKEESEVSMNISKIIVHPQKIHGKLKFDFALLEMKEEIDFKKHDSIRPICIPKSSSEDYVGWNATLTGWGDTGPPKQKQKQKLQYISGSVGTKQECLKMLVRDGFPVWLDYFRENSKEMLEYFRNQFPELPKEFLDSIPGMMDDFRKKLLGMSEDFFDTFSGMLYNFPDELPGILEYFQSKLSGMSDEFWDLFPEMLKIAVEFLEDNADLDNILCIDYLDGDSCPGDSGGPLVTKHAGDDGVTPGQNYEVIGVVSYGKARDCNATGWTWFGSVTSIKDWIEQSVGTDHTDCPRD